MSSCTLLLCQSGSGSRHSLRTRTVRRRWPAGHSTIGCYSPDKGPDPGAAHNGGPEAQPLNIDVKKKKNVLARWWALSENMSLGYLLLQFQTEFLHPCEGHFVKGTAFVGAFQNESEHRNPFKKVILSFIVM